ncbi:MAG TPA: RDD family protein [Sphingobacteriaceae bacterium]
MVSESLSFKFKPNLQKRILATLLDYGIYFLVFYIYVNFLGHANDEGGKTVDGLLFLPLPITWFCYFIIVESIYGATLGYQAFNLKVVAVNRKLISFRQTLKRHLLDPIDIFFYGIPAIIAIKNSEKHQRIGDMWANTIVIDLTDPEQYIDHQESIVV